MSAEPHALAFSAPDLAGAAARTPVRASLMITCLGDALYPRVGVAAVEVLGKLGVAVDFPGGQTCCGQPAYNAGHAGRGARAARAFLRAFADSEYVVSVSGSCAAMVRDGFPRLFAGRPEEAAAAALAARTFEFSEFLVDVLGVEELPVARRGDRHLPPLLPHAPPAGRRRAARAPAGHGRGS